MAPVFLRIRSLTVDSPGGILYINYSYLRVEVSLSFENNEGYPSFVLIQHENKSHSGGDYYGYIYKILRYIDENFSRDISMNDLSEITGLSSDYMSRKFKEVLHMPPSEYLRKFRIARAMELLCTTDMSVTEVAEQTGFSDVSLFSRVFKQAVGIPPVSYKKNAGSTNSGGDIQ